MKSTILCLLFCLIFYNENFAQKLTDSTIRLKDVNVQAYFPKLFNSAYSFTKLDSGILTMQGARSNIRSFNFISGVQMEERSPASYRLSIRGSLIRSPFGIRNLKIYVADFPFTDASGNTYLNLLDPTYIKDVLILKGPQASHLGANTGGSILINSSLNSPFIYNIKSLDKSRKATVGLEIGSFNEIHQHFQYKTVSSTWESNLFQSWQKSDGYRENSGMQRNFIQWDGNWIYKKNASLKFYSLYSHLDYQTPGGLTKVQMENNPQMARPATNTLPGAISQKAGIINKSLLLGLSHNWKLNSHLNWHFAGSTLYSDFENPFITNYESRAEHNWNFRTYFSDLHKLGIITQQLFLGVEGATISSRILNTENLSGERGNTLAADDLKVSSSFIFARGLWNFNNKLNVEAGLSLNWHSTIIEHSLNSSHNTENKLNAKSIWAPKLAFAYNIFPSHVLFASINKGFSSPSLAEIRPSNMQVNSSLGAEYAWNHEIGWRFQPSTGLNASVNYYYQNLKNSIVRRLDAFEQEYFINAGTINQTGLEISLSTPLWKSLTDTWLKAILWEGNLQFQHFRFKDYQILDKDLKGLKLTGTPSFKWNQRVQFIMTKNLSFIVTGYYQSSVPLDDANTQFTSAYSFYDTKINMSSIPFFNYHLNLYLGINNIFNEKYSLGPDLNAVGSRYFNPAPLRNFYTGLKLIF